MARLVRSDDFLRFCRLRRTQNRTKRTIAIKASVPETDAMMTVLSDTSFSAGAASELLAGVDGLADVVTVLDQD